MAGAQSPQAGKRGCRRADLPLEVEEDLSYLQGEPAVSGREAPCCRGFPFLSPSPQRSLPLSALPVLCQTQEWL